MQYRCWFLFFVIFMAMKRPIIHVLDIRASPDTVFNAIATIPGLSAWWTSAVTGTATPGGIIQFRFGEVFRPDMKVLMSDRSTIRWECVSGEKDWAGSTFRFTMDETAGMIRLTFAQDYAIAIGDEKYGKYNFNWGYYLYSLKKYCESGIGLPFR
jgi:hypothetical protein